MTSIRRRGKTLQDVKEYWSSHGRKELGIESGTLKQRDIYLQEVIESEICKWLRLQDNLLDIGCGDGTSTLRFASQSQKVLGVDYVAERVRKASELRIESGQLNIIFEEGDILDLSPIRERHGLFDTVVTIRCLINLPTWKLQEKGIEQIAGVVKPGGRYIASEGWAEGYEGMNMLRRRAGLQSLKLVEHNRYISRRRFEREISRKFRIIAYQGLGFYLFMSRLFQPVFVHPDSPRHDHDINQVSGELFQSGIGHEYFGECDYAGIYVLERLAD